MDAVLVGVRLYVYVSLCVCVCMCVYVCVLCVSVCVCKPLQRCRNVCSFGCPHACVCVGESLVVRLLACVG